MFGDGNQIKNKKQPIKVNMDDEIAKVIFKGILKNIREIIQSIQASSLFLLYAPNSTEINALPANAEVAERILHWLQDLGLKVYGRFR